MKPLNLAFIFLPLLAILQACDISGSERYSSGYKDGYASGYNTTCKIRTTLVEGAWDDRQYSKGYQVGYADGSIACKKNDEGLDTAQTESKTRQVPAVPLSKATGALIAPNVQASLSKSVSDQAPRSSAFKNAQDQTDWLEAMSPKLETRISNREGRLELLNSVHYEASRAGLDPQLVLGMIEVLSNFDKTKTGQDGKRGYMQVHPNWVKLIGKEGDDLFKLITNLRYGCIILRHYLDIEKGNLFRALNRYRGQLPDESANDSNQDDSAFPREVENSWKNHWAYDERRTSS